MIDDNELTNAERYFDFSSPSEFRNSLPQLRQILDSLAFQKSNLGFVALTASGMTSAWENGLPNDLVPFCLQPQSNHVDYYCFHRKTNETDSRIMVFADHAIVYDWPDVYAFLKWLQAQ